MKFNLHQVIQERLEKNVALKLKQLAELKKDFERLEKIYFEETDSLRKARRQDQLDENDKAQATLEFEIDGLHAKLNATPHIHFPKALYEYLTEYDFIHQKKEFTSYLKRPNKVGAFVVHSEVVYEKPFEQAWLWRHIFLKYLDEDIRQLSVFTPRTRDISDILYDFKLSINREKYINEYAGIDEDITEDIELLVKEIALLLENYSIVIPIYIHQSSQISIFSDFIERIWKPICKGLLALDEIPKHKLLLFIVDNHLQCDQYYTRKPIESVTLFKPYRITKVKRLTFGDLQQWLDKGRYERTGVFFKHESICKKFLEKFIEGHHLEEYLPNCGRIEKLLEKICCDLHHDHFKLDFQSLSKKYGKQIH